jgi:CRP/FNR family cyclic AMP-dependent transcriptional regulator
MTNTATVADALRDVPLFTQLRGGDLQKIAEAAHTRAYARNSIIAFEDRPGEALYVVLSGQVKIVLTAEDGREVILSTRTRGDFFGEMSLIDDQPVSANVIAMEDSELLILHREDFQRCLEEMPQVAFGLLRAFCKRLRQADSKISSLVLQDVPARVAGLLLDLADQNDGVHISQQLTHHLIAQMVGSSRETVSRAMGDLTTQGLVEVTRQTMTIPNRRRSPRTGRPSGGQELVEVSRRTITIRNRSGLEAAAGRS